MVWPAKVRDKRELGRWLAWFSEIDQRSISWKSQFIFYFYIILVTWLSYHRVSIKNNFGHLLVFSSLIYCMITFSFESTISIRFVFKDWARQFRRLLFNSPKDSQKSSRNVSNILCELRYWTQRTMLDVFKKIVMPYRFPFLSFALILDWLSACLLCIILRMSTTGISGLSISHTVVDLCEITPLVLENLDGFMPSF